MKTTCIALSILVSGALSSTPSVASAQSTSDRPKSSSSVDLKGAGTAGDAELAPLTLYDHPRARDKSSYSSPYPENEGSALKAEEPVMAMVPSSAPAATTLNREDETTASPKVLPVSIDAKNNASSPPALKKTASPTVALGQMEQPVASPSASAPSVQVPASAQLPADQQPNSTPAATGTPAQTQTVPQAQSTSEPFRRALPSPLDPVFCTTEYPGGPLIGIPDTDPVYPLEAALWKAFPVLKKARIKVYGWINPGGDFYSSSHHSNIPLSYAIVPNKLELDQLVGRIERNPDTVQQDHIDWGFRCSLLYGIDYRWTAAQGWYPATNELFKHNYLYGLDPVELYGNLYIPKILGKKIFDGLYIRFGRYISPPDIEAQLSPDNFLWTHSLMFDFDAYTYTGVQATWKFNNYWMLNSGIHAGNDMAPWAQGAIPSAEILLRGTTKSNNDSLYFGVDAINNGQFQGSNKVVQAANEAAALSAITGMTISPVKVAAHDNLQQFNATWSHRFNRRFNIMTEGYFLYSINALQGGSVNNGPPRPYNALTGPGKLLPGTSVAWGAVSYWNCKITDRDYITLRPVDYLGDPRGWRSGFPMTDASWTLGWIHRFSDLLCIRPEIRFEHTLSQKAAPYDNGTRRAQFTVGMDLIQRF